VVFRCPTVVSNLVTEIGVGSFLGGRTYTFVLGAELGWVNYIDMVIKESSGWF
jgi:hypothetical protein